MTRETIYAPSRPTGRETVRPLPAGHVRPPRFLWPSQRHMLPSRCRNCNALLLAPAPPTADDPIADVVCLMCSRVACELKADAMRKPLTAEEWQAPTDARLPTRRPIGACTDCDGPTSGGDHLRCGDCVQIDRQQSALATRLAMLLSDGVARRKADLTTALGVPDNSVRHALYRAKQRGVQIVRGKGGMYRLEIGGQP